MTVTVTFCTLELYIPAILGPSLRLAFLARFVVLGSAHPTLDWVQDPAALESNNFVALLRAGNTGAQLVEQTDQLIAQALVLTLRQLPPAATLALALERAILLAQIRILI